MKKVIFFCLIILLAAVSSCKKENNPLPPEDQPKTNLTLEDVTCTEAWINLSTSNLPLPADVDLYRDSSLVESINLTSSDTIMYIDSLLPNQSYSFRSIIQSTNQSINSASLLATTLDSTSHDYNFQVYLFGEHQHSIIRDIAIIDQNNIWAVGEIYLLDSLGQTDPHAYNILHWDGNVWEIKRLRYYGNCSAVEFPPLRAICVFSESDIIVSNGGSIGWFNGINLSLDCSINQLLTGAINKIWGRSDNDLYVAGNSGNIFHYNGQSWSRMESGTTVDLLDIWGSSDGTLWSCGYTSDYGTSVLLRNAGTGWGKVYEGYSGEYNNGYKIGPLSGIWSKNKFRIYLSNKSGLYIQPNSNELLLEKEIASSSYFCFGVDGTDDNNIFVCGERFVGHWNGVSYREYPGLYGDFKRYYSIKAKGNTVCAGGTDYNGPIFSQAVIVLAY